MKRIYTLAEALAKDPARIAKTQSLTLDSSRPHMGLKGSHGLSLPKHGGKASRPSASRRKP
ncbi:hypothetical protein [Janthinobacterium sp. LB3P112]|uniref:hypothetical protein n=1 Tax=Janthinobacterium sp. LB3P112 TaxID=3424196 RepID=UPI003F27C23E